MTAPPDPEKAALLEFLEAQRSCVLAVVAGLDGAALNTPVLPSGWTALGLIEHLADAERHWFGQVATGSDIGRPWPYDDTEDEGPFATAQPVAVVLAYYADQCARANAFLATTALSTPPVGQHIWDGQVDHVPDLRWIVLHMIEETARHVGHLDVVRELIDGRIGLGPR